MNEALISLGGNLGNPGEAIAAALRHLHANTQITVQRTSSYYRTPAIGGADQQPDFLNAAALLETDLSPHELLAVLQLAEETFGRTRDQRWDARSLDLDLLLFGADVIQDDVLELPHRRMSFRRFVIEPAAEIAPELIHPSTGRSLEQLRDHLRDAFPLIAIADPGQSWPMAVLMQQTECEWGSTLEQMNVFFRKRADLSALSDEAMQREILQLSEQGHLQSMLEKAARLLERSELQSRLGNHAAVLVSWSLQATIAKIENWPELPELVEICKLFKSIVHSATPPKLLVRNISEHVPTENACDTPTLWVDPTDIEWAVREVNAAALAMATAPVKVDR
ncbi:MAG: 2-amino-4-hydroxy-6-hydroxymethyldihydropteridine diphosphokinase [bacterium]|nr:2-amino-4-hydroxy-6-hydroxymethyldihydropteridine diphosphokinase [bacterium]